MASIAAAAAAATGGGDALRDAVFASLRGDVEAPPHGARAEEARRFLAAQWAELDRLASTDPTGYARQLEAVARDAGVALPAGAAAAAKAAAASAAAASASAAAAASGHQAAPVQQQQQQQQQEPKQQRRLIEEVDGPTRRVRFVFTGRVLAGVSADDVQVEASSASSSSFSSASASPSAARLVITVRRRQQQQQQQQRGAGNRSDVFVKQFDLPAPICRREAAAAIAKLDAARGRLHVCVRLG